VKVTFKINSKDLQGTFKVFYMSFDSYIWGVIKNALELNLGRFKVTYESYIQKLDKSYSSITPSSNLF